MKKPLLSFFLTSVAAVGSIWILRSDGFYYIDECAHYLFSRFVLQALPATVQTWHRPIPQWLFALPAQLGHTFTMFFALALYLSLLYLTYRIAVLKGIKHAEWVVILAGFQPVLFDLSYACMTEVPAAYMITLSYWFHLKGKHSLSLTAASLVILCRSEMYIFAGLMFLVYAWKREWKILPLVLIGPLLWIGSTTIISGNLMTFFREWSWFAGLGKFIPGVSVTHYVANVHTTFGIAQTALFVAGVVMIAGAGRSAKYGIIYSTLAMTLILHTLAGAEIFHWTGSIGELRYMAVVGPFFALIAVYGVSEILDRLKSSGLQTACSLLILTVVVFNCTLTTHPRRWPNYNRMVIEMTRAAVQEYPSLTLLSNNAVAAYVMDVAPSGGPHYARLNNETLNEHPECLILWEPFTANSIFFQTALTKEQLLLDTTVTVVERTRYWSAEYLLLYRNTRRSLAKRDASR